MRASPHARPTIAERIGIVIATSVPKVKARMIMATARPITSLLLVSASDSSLPMGPPTATCMPAALPGAAASSTEFPMSSVRSADPTLEQNGDERGVLVLADLRLPLLAERARGAVDVRQLLDGLVRGDDRLLVLLVGDLARLGVEDDRARPVLLRRELPCQQVRRTLAIRPGEAEVVVRVAPNELQDEDRRDERDDPDPEDDPFVPGREHAEPVEKFRHGAPEATALSPRAQWAKRPIAIYATG